jgi:hypothetical protein
MRHGLWLIVVLSVGCSSFNRDWKRAAALAAPTNDIAGAWEGKWVSDANGHNGRLRCLLTQTNEMIYEARYHAKFWKIFSYRYTVPMRVRRNAAGFTFTGDANLGWLAGGVYEYRGFASPTNFFSTYVSKQDQGTFRMQRPKQ